MGRNVARDFPVRLTPSPAPLGVRGPAHHPRYPPRTTWRPSWDAGGDGRLGHFGQIGKFLKLSNLSKDLRPGFLQSAAVAPATGPRSLLEQAFPFSRRQVLHCGGFQGESPFTVAIPCPLAAC